LRGDAEEVVAQRERRLSVLTTRENLKAAIKKLIGLEGYSHLSTITGVDIESEIEVIYHITFRDALVSLRAKVPKEKPVLPTIVDLVSGASLYEREVHDLFGVTFEGNQELSLLLLPDRWPSDVYPLRKEWTPENISKRMRRRR
jgi:NADH:ubiquinone oxidoreductase subunit C